MPDSGTVHEREPLLAEVAAAAERVVASGRAEAVMLCGEPGIGKSTVLELGVAALARDWSVLRVAGRALGADRPFDATRLLLRRLGTVAHTPHPETAEADAVERTAVMLTRLAAAGPVTLVVDDLHWVDPDSIDLLDSLWTDFAEAPLLWLLAFRRPEAEAKAPVGQFVHRLERDRRTTTLDVPRLSLAAVTLMCAATGPTAAAQPGGLAQRVHERSRGNPLVIDALLRAPTTGEARGVGPAPIPSYVRDIFAGQLLALLPVERDAACLAMALDAPLADDDAIDLLAALGHSSGVARAAIRALIERGLLERLDVATIGTGHPVVAEIALELYAGTHLAAAAAALLTARRHSLAEFDAARLAETAGDAVAPELAVAVLAAGADGVVGASTVDAAVRWQRAAVRHAERLDPAVRAPAVARQLLRLAALLDGTPDDALEIAERAAQVAGGTDDRQLHLDAAVAVARAGWRARGVQSLNADLRRIAECGDAGGPRLGATARLLALRLAVVAGLGDDDVGRLAEECRQLAAVAGHPAAAAGVELLLWMRDRHEIELAGWTRLQAILADAGPEIPGQLVQGLRLEQAQILGDLPALGRLAADPALPLWRRLLARFEAAFLAGRWDDAQRVVDSMGPFRRHAEAGSVRAWLAAYRGEPVPPPEPARGPADGAPDTHHLAVAYGAFLRGEPARVPDHPYGERFLTMQEGRVRPVLAELQLESGDQAGFERSLARIEAMAIDGSRMDAASERLRGMWALRRGEREVALAHFRRAQAIFERLGLAFDAARDEASALALQAGDAAVVRMNELAEWFEDLGSAPMAARARASVAARPGSRSVPPAGVLTRREMEIARLVALGRSNAQIADELYLSVRTVTSHLDHAYTKLGIGSRAALAVYVRELDRNT